MGQESKKIIPMPQTDLVVNVINPDAAQMDEPHLETDSLVSYRMRTKRLSTEIRMKQILTTLMFLNLLVEIPATRLS
jgi:hypothetical protein